MQEYLREAFTQLNLLEADFDLSNLDKEKLDKLTEFVADDQPFEEEEIIDVDAETEKDLENTYAGKVILECECCHSRIYKNIRDVVIDKETELANIDEECPVCNCTLGWSVIGKIEKFNPDDIPEEPEEKEEEVELDLKGAQAELDITEPVEESLNESWVKEWWGQDLSDVDTLVKEYGLLAKKLDTKNDETLIKFVGPREKIKAAMADGYFYSLEYPESGAECSDDLAIYKIKDDIEVEEKCEESCDKLEEARKKKGQPWDPKPIKLNKNDIDVLFNLTKAGEIHDPIDIPEFSLDDYSLGHHELEEDDELIEWNVSGMELIPDLDFGWDPNVVNGTTWLLHADIDTGDVDDYIGTLSHEDVQKLIKKSRGIDLPLFFDKFDFSILESCEKGSLQEDFKEVEIKTDDQKLEMTSDENGKVTVTTEPLTEEDKLPSDDIEVTDYDAEEIVPLSDSEEEQIESNSEEEVEEEPVEEVEETEEEVTEEEPTEEESEEEEVEEIAEESFDYLANNFMKRTYHNVDNYKTTSAKESGNQLVVEGLITFNSGATKKTTFKFEPELLNNKQVRLRGLNETFSNRKNTFNVRCSIQDKKLIAESMRYNYIAKDKLNESVQIKGREVNKKK